jgi:hypothetical protein
MRRMKYWEIIADNLKKSGWSLEWVSAVDRGGRTIWVVDAHRGGKRFVVHADEKINRVSGTRICESGIAEFPALHSLQPLRNTARAGDGTTKV